MAKSSSNTVNLVHGVGRGTSRSNGSGNPKRLSPMAENKGGGSTKPIPKQDKPVGR